MSANKYTPPSKNNTYKKNKKYDNDINLYPLLLKEKESSNPQKASSSTSTSTSTKLSFAELLLNKDENKKAQNHGDGDGDGDENKDNPAPPPGWVYIKKINGKINYKYGIMSDDYVNMLLENKRQEKEYNKKSFKKRLAQLQWDRDILNDLLGDLSPHWKTKTLYETYNLEHLIKKKNKKNIENIQNILNIENDENEENKKEDEWICI
jgi:hypothetical protein